VCSRFPVIYVFRVFIADYRLDNETKFPVQRQPQRPEFGQSHFCGPSSPPRCTASITRVGVLFCRVRAPACVLSAGLFAVRPGGLLAGPSICPRGNTGRSLARSLAGGARRRLEHQNAPDSTDRGRGATCNDYVARCHLFLLSCWASEFFTRSRELPVVGRLRKRS
jgi:hypothetical protein